MGHMIRCHQPTSNPQHREDSHKLQNTGTNLKYDGLLPLLTQVGVTSLNFPGNSETYNICLTSVKHPYMLEL